jgi:hypothetical protein
MPKLSEAVSHIEALRSLVVIKNRKIYLRRTERAGPI